MGLSGNAIINLPAFLCFLLSVRFTNAEECNFWENKMGNFFEGSIISTCEDIRILYDEATYEGARAGCRCIDEDEGYRSLYQIEGSDRKLEPTDALQLNRLWKVRVNDKVQIPFMFKNDDFDEETKEIVREQLRLLEVNTGVVEFPERADNLNGYIIIENTNGCASYVGKIPITPQKLLLGPDCIDPAEIQHIVLHAAGMFHEQSRPDRDEFVTILTDNIEEGEEDNFSVRQNAESLGVRYDYRSIMHFSAYEFSKNGEPTIDAKGNDIGQRRGMSPSDTLQFRLMYQCKSGPREVNSYLMDQCSNDCPCWEDVFGCAADSECQGDLVCGELGQCKVFVAPDPTASPSTSPTTPPVTSSPTGSPTANVSTPPTESPVTPSPTGSPTANASTPPTESPVTSSPTSSPTANASTPPTESPTMLLSAFPTDLQNITIITESPTMLLSAFPTDLQNITITTESPVTPKPTFPPVFRPSKRPTESTPIVTPSPTNLPSTKPSAKVTSPPTEIPTAFPTKPQTHKPTRKPRHKPTRRPTRRPTRDSHMSYRYF